MENTQCYIGTPNGVVVCVDSRQCVRCGGRLYHLYSTQAEKFDTIDRMTGLMEQLYDKLNYPYPATNIRSFLRKSGGFVPRKEIKQLMKDEEILTKRGNLGTYIIRVQQRQNSSWQGRITWVERNKTENFRSVWEMVQLINGSLDTVTGPEETDSIGWGEEG